VIEVEDQDGDRTAQQASLLPDVVGRFEQSASVRKAGQGVGQSLAALLDLLALPCHREHNEGQSDAEQKRKQNDGREPGGGEHGDRFMDRHDEV
jgi:hypothetical protein